MSLPIQLDFSWLKSKFRSSREHFPEEEPRNRELERDKVPLMPDADLRPRNRASCACQSGCSALYPNPTALKSYIDHKNLASSTDTTRLREIMVWITRGSGAHAGIYCAVDSSKKWLIIGGWHILTVWSEKKSVHGQQRMAKPERSWVLLPVVWVWSAWKPLLSWRINVNNDFYPFGLHWHLTWWKVCATCLIRTCKNWLPCSTAYLVLVAINRFDTLRTCDYQETSLKKCVVLIDHGPWRFSRTALSLPPIDKLAYHSPRIRGLHMIFCGLRKATSELDESWRNWGGALHPSRPVTVLLWLPITVSLPKIDRTCP